MNGTHEEECTEAQTKQEEEMTKGIPKAQEGISAIWHCLPSRVSGWLEAIVF